MNYWGIQTSIDVIPTDSQNSDISTSETIQKMIALARDASTRPHINYVVGSLQGKLASPKTKQSDLVRAIFYWIKEHVRFREDESILSQVMGWNDPIQELLISPEVLIQMSTPEGDCDDFSMLVAAMLLAAKIDVWYVAVAVDPQEPNRWSHVYTVCYLPSENRYLYLDASHGKFPGWETPSYKFRKMVWKI